MAKLLKAPFHNSDPALSFQAVDISAVDFTPTRGIFRAINASVAGLITVVNVEDVSVQVYVNTGWNPQGGKTIKHAGSGDTATIIAAATD